MRSILFAALMICATSQAHAAVIYNWVNTSASTSGLNASGQLTVSDSAYAAGGLSINWEGIGEAYHELFPPPTDPIGLSFKVGGGGGGYDWVSARNLGHTVLDLTFLSSGLVTGSIVGNDTGSDFSMSGTGNNWDVHRYATDADSPCHATENDCGGGTGYWMLASAPQAVPEPFSASLLVLGFVALGVNRWARSQSQKGRR